MKGGKGMEEILRDIYVEYSQDIYRYFYGLTLDPVLSEDLTSEVFLEAVKSLHTFRAESSVKTWLYSIARHCWCHYLRKKKCQPPSGPEGLEGMIDNSSMEKQLCDRAMLQRIQELIQAQPERTREILRMRMQGFSYYEIGLQFGISESSARVIEFRAKTKLKQMLKKEGYIDE